jgi:hypothetical protein
MLPQGISYSLRSPQQPYDIPSVAADLLDPHASLISPFLANSPRYSPNPTFPKAMEKHSEHGIFAQMKPSWPCVSGTPLGVSFQNADHDSLSMTAHRLSATV